MVPAWPKLAQGAPMPRKHGSFQAGAGDAQEERSCAQESELAGEEIDEMLLCAEAQNTMAKTAKGTVAAGDAVSGEDRDETMRKTGKESGEAGEAQDGSEAVQKKAKKAPPPVTGYKLYSKAVIAEVKQEHPEAGTQDVIKIIKKMYGELDEGKKQVCVRACVRTCVRACREPCFPTLLLLSQQPVLLAS